ncbi:hypothetical protein [Bacteroides pyogenes]|uniref:hypothetical protein n=1 Tax=Bacteroides pyogenes TaxID=310300 RepID=UPI003FA0CC93
MKFENKVIVWAPDDFNALGLMRQLGKPEIDLFFLIKGRAGMASKSSHCKDYIETLTIQDGYDYLLKNFSKEKKKPIIITSGDGISVFIDQHKIELEKFFILSGTREQGVLEKITDKNNMTNLAIELGIRAPKSIFVCKNTEIKDWSYPCLIKPSHQRPGHYNEFKFKICKNESELKRVLSIVNPASEFILQEYIPKEKELLIYGARLLDENTIFAGAMIRDRFVDSGSSSHGFFCNRVESENYFDKDIYNQIELFLSKIDYTGLFSFEYGLVGTKAYFFEVNMRNDGTSHYFYQAGSNVPLAYVYSCLGIDYKNIFQEVLSNKWFVDELFDIENVLHFRLSLKQWKHDKESATIFKYYDSEDIEPYKYVKKNRLRQMLQDLILMKFRLYVVYILDKLGFKK